MKKLRRHLIQFKTIFADTVVVTTIYSVTYNEKKKKKKNNIGDHTERTDITFLLPASTNCAAKTLLDLSIKKTPKKPKKTPRKLAMKYSIREKESIVKPDQIN